MKKLLLCLILLWGWQQAYALETHVGLRFGVTVSKLAGNDWEIVKDVWEADLESMTGYPVSHSDYWGWGFSAGVLIELSLFRFLALQPEVLYTTYHGGMKLQNDFYSSDWAKLGTIYRVAEACLLLKIRPAKRVAIFAGPLVMYRFLPPKAIIIVPGDRESEPISDDSVFKELAYGVVGGVEFKLDKETFLEVRYNYNLTSFDNFGYPWDDDTVFHGIIASVGFLF
jgi:opacity protein-like surface antigen